MQTGASHGNGLLLRVGRVMALENADCFDWLETVAVRMFPHSLWKKNQVTGSCVVTCAHRGLAIWTDVCY